MFCRHFQLRVQYRKFQFGVVTDGGQGRQCNGNTGFKYGPEASTSGLIKVATSSSLSVGQSISTSMVMNQIASNATLSLPPYNDAYKVTGTTGIGHIAGGWTNRRIVLIFQDGLTVFHSLSANGIRLMNGANFSSSTFSTLTLIYEGTQWMEVCRTQ